MDPSNGMYIQAAMQEHLMGVLEPLIPDVAFGLNLHADAMAAAACQEMLLAAAMAQPPEEERPRQRARRQPSGGGGGDPAAVPSSPPAPQFRLGLSPLDFLEPSQS